MEARADLEYSLNIVTKYIKAASKYGGHIFGGYVRDVIVPRRNNPKCDVTFENLDIWFKKPLDANNFLRDTRKSYVEVGESEIYAFGILIDRVTTKTIVVNVNVSETCPIIDLNVDSLLYRLSPDDVGVFTSSGTEFPSVLLNMISRKRATVLPRYCEKLMSGNCMYYANRLEKFIMNGWTLEFMAETISCVKSLMGPKFTYQSNGNDSYLVYKIDKEEIVPFGTLWLEDATDQMVSAIMNADPPKFLLKFYKDTTFDRSKGNSPKQNVPINRSDFPKVRVPASLISAPATLIPVVEPPKIQLSNNLWELAPPVKFIPVVEPPKIQLSNNLWELAPPVKFIPVNSTCSKECIVCGPHRGKQESLHKKDLNDRIQEKMDALNESMLKVNTLSFELQMLLQELPL